MTRRMAGGEYGARWPAAPGPWNTPNYNLPANMSQLPMELVRTKLYPPFKNVTEQGVMQQAAGGFRPGFLFPWQGGQRFHAPNAAKAVVEARSRLAQLRAAVMGPQIPQGVSPPPYPMSTAAMQPAEYPNVREVPFGWRRAQEGVVPPTAVDPSGRRRVPAELLAVRQQLTQQPWELSAGSPRIVNYGTEVDTLRARALNPIERFLGR